MKIGLNLLHASPDIGGGTNYIENLLRALGKFDKANEYFAFVTASSECLVPNKKNFNKILIKIRGERRPQRIFYENTKLLSLIRKYKLDCMHWFANTQAIIRTVPAAISIYDLHVFHNGSTFSLLKRNYLRKMIPFSVKNAAVLLPISQSTMLDLQHTLHVAASRMVVVSPLLNDAFTPASDAAIADFRARFGLPEKYWLYVAHFYPHKNHKRLLQAYSRLRQNGCKPWPLVFRGDPHGSESCVRDSIKRFHLAQDVSKVPRMSIPDLSLLYASASAMIFPSLYEGAGLPVMEAMACGCPVAGSDIPAVKEFAGDSILYFNPLDVSSMEQAMAKIQADASLRENLRQKSLKRAEHFQAEAVIKNLLKAYEQAAKIKEN